MLWVAEAIHATLVPLELIHRRAELVFDRLNMEDEVLACLLDDLRWLGLSVCLTLEFDFVLQGMGFPVACKLHTLVSQQLHA